MSDLTDLGFASDARVAVVHADDIGMSHAANTGAFAALANGPATCGSVMAPCPWFGEAAAIARAEPAFDLGVHLTLNAEFDRYRWGPVASTVEVASLVGADGTLFLDPRDTVRHAQPEHVAIELRAQIQRALDAGIDVTHIDSHMGTLFHAKFFAIYLDLAREFAIPAFLPISGDAPDDGPTVEPIRAMGQQGWPLFDGFCADSLSFAPGDGVTHNQRRLDGLGPGLNYLICHPAQRGGELEAITDSAHCREFERTFYGGPAGYDALASAGIATIGMRPLRDLLQQRTRPTEH
ncbi:MAG: ChbG/HpnK family deacetylase [Acidimicrobiia bacterium]|nr:ChbG/HpnK family deacetylase [Acidimicrobiia bacterium]